VSLRVTDSSDATIVSSFVATVSPVNDAPDIELLLADKAQLVMGEDSSVVVGFRVTDSDSPVSSLSARVSSSNQDLFADASLSVQAGEVGQSTRFVTLRPLPNRSGTALIKISASDTQKTSELQFQVTVTAVNDAPVIAGLQDLELLQGSSSAAIPVTVTDVESAASALTFTLITGDANLLPQANLTVVRSGSVWNLTVKAGTSGVGVVPVGVVASDPDGGRAEATFFVKISVANSPPTILVPSSVRINEDQATTLSSATNPGTSPIVVFADDSTPVGELVITVSNTNPTLFPAGAVELVSVANRADARQIRLVPAANQFGEADVTVTARDRQGLVSVSVVRVVVRSVNDLPVLAAILEQRSSEDTLIVVPFAASDLETPFQSLAFSASADNETLFPLGSAEVSGSNLLLRPAANQSGSATFTFAVHDSDGGSVSRSFVVQVSAVNDAPVVEAPADVTMLEGGSVEIPVTLSDSDSGADDLVVTPRVVSSSSPALILADGLTVLPNPSNASKRILRIKPSAQQSGSAVISLTAIDGKGSGLASLPVTFRLTVQHVNQPPVIAPIPLITVTASGVPFPIVVKASDTDSGLDVEKIGFSQVQGVVFVNPAVTPGDGTLMFNVIADSTAPQDSEVTLTVVDREGASAQARFSLRVLAENSFPTIEGLASTATGEEDGAAVLVPVLVSDKELAASDLFVEATSDNEALIGGTGIQVQGTGANRSLSLKPNPNQFGTARITVKVTDKSIRNAPANTTSRLLTFTVAPVNDAPTLVFGNEGPIRVSLDGSPATQLVEQALTLGDLETTAQGLAVTVVSKNPTVLPNTAANIQVVGTGGARLLKLTTLGNAQSTSVDVDVTVTDGGALPDGSLAATRLSTVRSFRIEFVRNQHPPTIALESATPLTFSEDSPSAARGFTVGDEDASGAAGVSVSAIVDTPGVLSAVEISGTGASRSFRVIPAPNQFGSARLTLFARDPDGLVSSTSLDLSITPINDPPTLAEIVSPESIDEDSSEQTLLLGGIALGPLNETQGANLKPLKLSAVTAPQAGENANLITTPIITLLPDGRSASLRYTPRPNQNGAITVRVTVDDGETTNATVTRSVVIRVRPVNDAPSLGVVTPDVPLSVAEGQTSTPRALIVGDPDAVSNAIPSIAARSLTPNLLAQADIVIARTSNGTSTVAVRGTDGKTGAAEIELTLTGASGGTTTLRIPVLITHRPTLSLAASLPGGRLALFQDETKELRFLIGDSETDANQLRATSSIPTATELEPGPILAQGVELSNLGGGVLRAFITPNPGALGTADILITLRDLDGGITEFRLPVDIKAQPATVSIEVTPSSTFAAGTNVRLQGVVTGTGPFEFQWKKGTDNIRGATSRILSLDQTGANDAGLYTLTVQNPAGQARASVTLRVLTPPVIALHPVSQTIAVGRPIVLDVSLVGGDQGDVTYQWRKGGIPIPGETSASFIRSSATAGDAGVYDVVVGRLGTVSSVLSDAAKLDVLVDSLTLGDLFANAAEIPAASTTVDGKIRQQGSRRANNLNATREVQEPSHASKSGGRSVWAKWIAPANGTMQITTQGSSFDTLLAVYSPLTTPASVAQLELVDADDDGSDAFTSFVEFNAVKGRTYYVAIDGRLGAAGLIQLGWFSKRPSFKRLTLSRGWWTCRPARVMKWCSVSWLRT